MTIGLVLNDKGFRNLDLSRPDMGNPGIGGTQYCILLLAYYLCKYDESIKTCIIHYSDNFLPDCTECIIDNDSEIVDAAKEMDIVMLQNGQHHELYSLLEKNAIKTIIWAHNFIQADEARYLAQANYVKRVVCVGKQEYDHYIDHPVNKKMVTIYNMIPSFCNEQLRSNDFKPIVTYAGSLIPVKGFHVLAKIWKDVIKEIPYAQLHIIGGGNLYSRNVSLGQYGIAEESYEQVFMPYLCDEKGELLQSVHFHGVMGHEKLDIYRDSSIGVINPSALTETFGLVAAEMEGLGIPIVTKKKNGLIDTVIHKKTGYLFTKEKQFMRYITKLLRDREKNCELGENAVLFVRDKFSPEKIIPKWINTFNEVMNQIAPKYEKPVSPIFCDYKIIRIINRNLRKAFPSLPAIIDWSIIVRRKMHGIKNQ